MKECKTDEIGWQVGITHPYPYLKQNRFHSRLNESSHQNLEFSSDKAVAVVNGFKKEIGNNILLWDAAHLAATGLAPNLIPRRRIEINPFLIGSEISLFLGKLTLNHDNASLVNSSLMAQCNFKIASNNRKR